MTNSRAIGGLVFSLAMLTGVIQGWAAEPDSSARAEAKERLDHGLYFMENGAYAAALGEFEKAQELAPSRLLLYHIALAYVAMDKPVDALESLDEVLSADGTLKSEYVERAKTAKEQQLQRIGELDVKVNVPSAVKVAGEPGGEVPPAPQVKAAIEVDGERVLVVRFTGMSLANDVGQPTYDGAVEIKPDLAALRHAVLFDASEGVIGWYVGYDGSGCVSLVRSGNSVTLVIEHG